VRSAGIDRSRDARRDRIGSYHQRLLCDNGAWGAQRGIYAGAIAVAFAGGGLYSLDNGIQSAVPTNPTQIWYAFAAAVVVAGLNRSCDGGPEAE